MTGFQVDNRVLTVFKEQVGPGKPPPRSVDVSVPQKGIGEEAVVVWDAALVLAHFLEVHQVRLGFVNSKPLHVVDVGAGTGVVGLVCAALGAKVTLTDLDRFVPLLEEGIAANRPDPQATTKPCDKEDPLSAFDLVEARKLHWGSKSDVQDLIRDRGTPDLVVISDCVYYESSLGPLLSTLEDLAASSSPPAPIYLSYECRDYSEEKRLVKESFFNLASEKFELKVYDRGDCHADFSAEDITVVRLTLQKPSGRNLEMGLNS